MKSDLEKYCISIRCPHYPSLSECSYKFTTNKVGRCCLIDHVCVCMPKGYQDTFYFFLWKKSVLEEINEMS